MAKKAKVSDQRQLQMFVDRVQELADTRMMRERQLHNYKPVIKLTTDEASVDGKEPDEDDLKSFLLTFRHFISNDEPIYIYNVFITANKRLKAEHHDKRDFLSIARSEWKKAETGLEAFIVDQQQLTALYVLDLYINGRYFHNDPTHADKLREFKKYPIRLDRMRFFLSLQDFTNIINQVGNMVAFGLKNDWFDFSDET
jgi:hypothetical protein